MALKMRLMVCTAAVALTGATALRRPYLVGTPELAAPEERALALYPGAEHVNVQPHSGSQATTLRAACLLM